MKYLNLYIRSEPTNEPINIQIKIGMRDFSEVKLYIAKVNGKPSILPKHRWYIYYYFRNPVTKKMQKFHDYCKINLFKTVKERKECGEAWINAYTILLNQGFNPFDKLGIAPKQFEETIYTVRTALQYAHNNKIGRWKKATADDYNTRMNVFLEWCSTNAIDAIDVRELKEIHIISFMNWLIMPLPKGRGVGGTSQDNYKRCLSGLFGKLVKDKIIAKNLCNYSACKVAIVLKASKTFCPFLMQVSVTDRMTAKICAPFSVLKWPDIFCFTFTFLMALSELLLSGKTS